MNKYQEAIYEIKKVLMVGRIDIETLQELVDRAIPVKPVVLTKTICCGKCDMRLGSNNGWTQAIVNFCPTCGQAIDWSEDE